MYTNSGHKISFVHEAMKKDIVSDSSTSLKKVMFLSVYELLSGSPWTIEYKE